jgi:hypothetical protein
VYGDEHALTWHIDSGYQHKTVDSGDTAGKMSKSQVLLPDGPFPLKVIDEFLNRIPNAENNIFIFVYDRLVDYTNLGCALE